jgi:hypothetical protein
MKIEMIREGELLCLVVDCRKVVERNTDGQWNAADPGWSVADVELWGERQIWKAIEFSYDGEPLDVVFCFDNEGNPHAVKVTAAGPMPRA